MLTFVRTCDTRACYVTSWVGWGGVGDVDVRENLRHTRMLRHFLGWVGWGMLTFVRTCDTRACYVTSWVGWGGVGDVDVRENLRHTRMLRILASEALTCVKSNHQPIQHSCSLMEHPATDL